MRQFGGSALTDDIAVPKERPRATASRSLTSRRATSIFLSLTLGWAEALGAHDIFIGVNALDYSGYPDCRPEFIASFAETARLATKDGVEGRPFTIHAPLQHLGKAADRAGSAPARARSGDELVVLRPDAGRACACGLCDSCRLRRAGFADAGVEDRTAYAT